jgi:hypothetical protein
MSSIYLTNYKHLFEMYNAILNMKLNALATFEKAVDDDWQTVRKKRAFMRIDEYTNEYEKLIKIRDSSKTEGNQPISRSDLLEGLRTALTPMNKEVFEALPLVEPEIVPLVKGAIARAREQIEKYPIPKGENAVGYADEKLREQLREQLKQAAQNAPSVPQPRIFQKAL